MSTLTTRTSPFAAVDAGEVHRRLGLQAPLVLAEASRAKPLAEWRMETDDAPILRYLFAQLAPRRHLEFGTWQGAGTLLCLQSCDATVWTLNLREGEKTDSGEWAYYEQSRRGGPDWAHTRTTGSGKTLCQTDALGYVGRLVHDQGLGHRVCQIYCDSRDWDTTNYPPGFFDTALIDGGHTPEVVVNDTQKTLPLVRSGGILLWHDFCLDADVRRTCSSVQGVIEGLSSIRGELDDALADLFWIEPSWLLVGVKR